MILIKTILFFLQNKQRELKLFKRGILLLQIIAVVSGVFLLLAGIGYVGLLIYPSIHENSSLKNFILTCSIKSFGYLVFSGMLYITSIIAIIGAGIVCIFAIYVICMLCNYIYRNFKWWWADFIQFIKDNWYLAQIQSGKVEKYLIEVNIKNIKCYLHASYGTGSFTTKAIARQTFTENLNAFMKNNLFPKELLTDLFYDIRYQSFIKEHKLKPEMVKLVKFSDFYKNEILKKGK